MNLSANPPTISEVRDIAYGVVASISHDLRTPLSAILLWTKILSEQENLSPQELKDGLRSIRECVEEQFAIIEDIVDSSQIATGQIRLKQERVDLAEELSSITDNFRAEADKSDLELREDYDETLGVVLVDHHRLKQLAGSMLGNAIARSPQGASIEISGVRRGDLVEISVSDSGEGLNDEALYRILERYPSAKSPLNKTTALYTASKLARLFGGDFEIHSEGGKTGARFTLTLDLPNATAEAE